MANPRIVNPTLAPAGTNVSDTSLNGNNWQVYIFSEDNMVNSLSSTKKEVTVDLAFDIPPRTKIPENNDISGEYISNDKTVEVRVQEQADQNITLPRIISKRLRFQIDLEDSADEIKYLRFSIVSGTTEKKKKVVSTDPDNHPIINEDCN